MATTANRRAARQLRDALYAKFVHAAESLDRAFDRLITELASARIQIRLLTGEVKEQNRTIALQAARIAELEAQGRINQDRIDAQAYELQHLRDQRDALADEADEADELREQLEATRWELIVARAGDDFLWEQLDAELPDDAAALAGAA